MISERKKFSEAGPVSLILLLCAVVTIIASFSFAFCISVERVVEYTNGWRNQNSWVPFYGGPLDYIGQLPNALYVSLVYFPSTCFVVIIFFPLLVFAVPIYDVFFHHNFEFLLAAWAPLLGAVGLFVLALLLLRREKNVLPEEPE